MSTIASPRPSISLSSRRTSVSTDTTSRAGSQRRHRAALRDYYGIKASEQAALDTHTDPPTPTLDPETESELDKPDFDPEHYVKNVLAKESLEGILRVEAGLISEVRNLDGEKKALVYDNYSKLIAATDTIRKMRMSMDPLAPTTGELMPAVGHIAATATELSGELRKHHGNAGQSEEAVKKRKQQEIVSWVLDAPGRLQGLVEEGKREQAVAEWEKISNILERWNGVKGANEVKRACQDALALDDAT